MELRLVDLHHSYGEIEVLRGIGFSVPAGRIACIVGPSGCGKSTLLRLIGGLERPRSGHVMQIGEAPSGSLNPLTYIFQDFALLPWRTVEGNVRLALEDHRLGRGEAGRIVDDVLARTGLSEFRAAFPRQISGGMKQRVAIARALAVSPAFLLMDEPLSALDAQTRELLMEDLIGLWTRERFSAVYVTHNLREAVRLGHQVVVLSRRPGSVRDVLGIDMPLGERAGHPDALDAHYRRLWRSVRDEARAAAQEMTGG